MNKKGFTLVELLAVTILLIIVAVITIVNILPTAEKNKLKSFVNEALTISDGAKNLYLDNRLNQDYSTDSFRGTSFQNRSDGKDRACIAYYNLIPVYVNKLSKKYNGSVEVCYGINCEYDKKIWLTDGENYIIAKVADGNLSTDDVTTDKTAFTNYLTCGQNISQINPVFDYPFSGMERTFQAPVTGNYSLEAWGAQGGMCNTNRGGYGGYAYSEVTLQEGDILYLNVGGMGDGKECSSQTNQGGYNGGGPGGNGHAGGGGATSITTKSGLLNKPVLKDYIYIVAGGGGGGTSNTDKIGYSGGGFKDGSGNTTQTANVYGGGGGTHGTGGGYFGYNQGRDIYYRSYGGSGYIGNPSNRNAVMYGYEVPESTEVNTKTINTTNVSEVVTPQYAKIGNGFARITYLGN